MHSEQADINTAKSPLFSYYSSLLKIRRRTTKRFVRVAKSAWKNRCCLLHSFKPKRFNLNFRNKTSDNNSLLQKAVHHTSLMKNCCYLQTAQFTASQESVDSTSLFSVNDVPSCSLFASDGSVNSSSFAVKKSLLSLLVDFHRSSLISQGPASIDGNTSDTSYCGTEDDLGSSQSSLDSAIIPSGSSQINSNSKGVGIPIMISKRSIPIPKSNFSFLGDQEFPDAHYFF